MISATKKIKPGNRIERGEVRKGPHPYPPGPETPRISLGQTWFRYRAVWGGLVTNFIIHFWPSRTDVALFMTSLAERFLKLCMFIENYSYAPNQFLIVSKWDVDMIEKSNPVEGHGGPLLPSSLHPQSLSPRTTTCKCFKVLPRVIYISVTKQYT